MVLRVDGRPAVELQPAGRRRIAEEGKRQLAILPGVLRSGDNDATVGARQDLGLAVEIGRARQQRAEWRPNERTARFLADRIVEERQALAVCDTQTDASD